MANTGQMQSEREATQVVTEIEQKYDVHPGFQVPDLSGVRGVASQPPTREELLDATYFDTADLRLVTHRLTLRRRTGGPDEGWHLKRPRADGYRDELRRPLGRGKRAVPPALRDVVEVYVRGGELVPVVRLTTRRSVHELLDDAGRVLAEVAFDEVNASTPAAHGESVSVSSWSEVEVELVAGDVKLLKAIAKQLVAAGAVPSSSRSKLARALGDRLPSSPSGGSSGGSVAPVDHVAGETAGAVVLAYVARQVAHLEAQDPLVRADEEDAVHQMRVACRRLRSVLAIYRPLFDRAVTDPIRAELAWLGGELGAARDAEVVRDHLRGAAEAELADLLLGPVVDRIVDTMNARYRAAHDEALVELAGARYFALLDALDALVAAPPWTEVAQGDPASVVLPQAAKTWSRLRRLVAAADAAPTAHERDLLLHEVRKAAKRARYAGESLVAAFGKDAQRYAARMAAIQEVLGDHQDSVVVRQELFALAAAAQLAGESAFSYGRLHALEQARADQTDQAFALAWQQARDARHRAWLG